LGFYGREGPHVTADSCSGHFLCDILLLRSDKRPDLINLNTLSRNIANGCIVELFASRTDFSQEAENGSFCNASHADRGPNGASFDQRRDHRDFFVHTQLVHALIIRKRFRIVTSEVEVSKEKSLGSFAFFHGSVFIPSGSDRRLGRRFPFFGTHSHKTALAADLAAASAHFGHNLGDHRAVHGGFRSNSLQRFIDYSSRILNNVQLTGSLGHVSSMARIRKRFNRGGFQIDPLPTLDIGTERTGADETASPRPVFSSRGSHR
jgi:hypothetical protein